MPVICVVHTDDGPVVLQNLSDDKPRLWPTVEAARKALKEHRLAHECPSELITLWRGEPL